MDCITHDDANVFFDDLQARKDAGHKTQSKDSTFDRCIGFLDLTARAWVRISLLTLKAWAVPDEHLHYKEMLGTAAGREQLFGGYEMKETIIDGHPYQVRDEPDWVDQW